MKDHHKPIIGLGIGLCTVTVITIYQYLTMQARIQQLEQDLQTAQNTISEQGGIIQNNEKTLEDRAAEIARKEQQIKQQEQQIQEKEKQLQVKESDLKEQKSEVVRQQEIASRLRANTETLGICLQGISLAILASTPVEAAAALNAIEAKCEEAAEIVENL
jgi:uncharacterized protein (DUF3084 family)|nr:MAG: hypothetical protein EDM05_32115 [Leptolyngbya sp. IPPAS B-1204]